MSENLKAGPQENLMSKRSKKPFVGRSFPVAQEDMPFGRCPDCGGKMIAREIFRANGKLLSALSPARFAFPAFLVLSSRRRTVQ